MHIRDIQIRNVRSLRSHRWSFARTKCAGWHVVLGDNGSGKSSLLRAIALALVGAGRAEGLRQTWNDWLTHGQQEGEIRLMLWSATPDVVHSANLPADNLYSPGVKLSRKSGDETELADLPPTDQSRQSLAQSLNLDEVNTAREWFSTSFGPFRRFTGGSGQESKLPPLLARHLSLFDEGIAFTKCLDWLQDLKFRALEHDPEGGLLGRLIRFVNESDFLPSGVRIENVTSRNVMFRDANGVVVPVMDLSDGYRSVLSMTFEIIRQMAMTFGPDEVFDPDNPTKVVPEGVVIVDEIDTHLHPTWQSRIGHWFCDHFPNVQFIVSTHSPLVCQSAENGSVYLLPCSGSGEKGGKLKRDTLLRLVHGTVLDAYGTEAFGSEAAATRSPRSRELHRRLAQLNNRELLGGLSPKERRERDRLRRMLPSVAAGTD
ncbi:MAG: AAA family ATPase [Thiotrichales bacterium]|nr:AAA family ATPase [Thiotrichales bacterium]